MFTLVLTSVVSVLMEILFGIFKLLEEYSFYLFICGI